MVCNGICNNFKAAKPITGGRYEHGQKMSDMSNFYLLGWYELSLL